MAKAARRAFVQGIERAERKKKRRGINSVEVGLNVLKAIIDLSAPASLKDIARNSGLDSSQAHRYVSSLMNFGLLEQEPVSARYALGPAALQIGLAALARLDFLSIADSFAQSFTTNFRVSTLLSVWGPYGPTIIKWYQGDPPVYTTLTVGSILPMTTSASGRVYLAYLSEELIADALKRSGSSIRMQDSAALRADKETIRKTFLATTDSTVVPGLQVAACPILSLDDRLIAVVSMGASDSAAQASDRQIQNHLVSGAIEISRRLGARNLPVTR